MPVCRVKKSRKIKSRQCTLWVFWPRHCLIAASRDASDCPLESVCAPARGARSATPRS